MARPDRERRAELLREAETLEKLAAKLRREAAELDDAPGDGATRLADETHLRARRLIIFRRKRDGLFANGIFADPAWDILLDLYASEANHLVLSTSSVCIASAVPATTALRHLNALIALGVLRSQPDHRDARRRMIGLTDTTREKMRQLLALPQLL